MYCTAFRLAMQELRMSNVFEGPEDSRYFSHDIELLQKKEYLLAGQLVGLSLAHDGPSFCSLNEHLFDFMMGTESLFDCVAVLPMDVQTIIQEVSLLLRILRYLLIFTLLLVFSCPPDTCN